MALHADVLYGSVLSQNRPPIIDSPVVSISGSCNGASACFELDRSILSKHMLLLGGTGCGKTNTFFHLVDQLKSGMTDNDTMIIFDTKGDYIKKFYDPYYDSVISATDMIGYTVSNWNLFKEILIDGFENKEACESAIAEISWSLFSGSIKNNNSNPFFPNAARDLFASILTWAVRTAGGDPELIDKYLDNEYLKSLLDTLSAKGLREMLSKYRDQQAALTYIGDGENPQGLGVFAELQSVLRNVLVGSFAKRGDFSIREFIRKRGGRALFIEYDLDRGSTLTPIYKLLIDLALKETMGSHEKSKVSAGTCGNVYIFCDEFKLLPDLVHIEDAVNFGRSMGVKVFAGLQSIEQLTENYGESRGKNIAAGFSTVLSFRANDEISRNFTVGLHGKNYYIEHETYMSGEKKIGNTVEDWDIIGLGVGEAIVGITGEKPYRFKFDLYGG